MTKAKTNESGAELFPNQEATVPKRSQVTKGVKVSGRPDNLPAIAEPPPPPTNMLAIIADAAANQNVDVGKMRELLSMQKEIRAEEARMSFTRAFIRLQADLPVIDAKGRIVIEGKGGRRGQSTLYATFNEIHRVTKPFLKDNGFALSFEPDIGPEGRIIMRGHLDHVDGHSKTCAIPLPLETSGSKNNVQGVGSSISYGKRYATISLLNIVSHAAEDADLDGHSPDDVAEQAPVKTIDKNQLAALTKAIREAGATAAMVCDKCNVEDLADVPLAMFQPILDACARFKAANASRGQQ